MVAPFALLITGIPGAGKSTVARLVAARLPRAACIEAEDVQAMIVSGAVWPGEEPTDEAGRQLRARAFHTALLARSFFDAGFVPVVAEIVVVPSRLAIYQEIFGDRPLRLVTLAPTVDVALERDRRRDKPTVGDRFAHLDAEQREQLGGVGLWIDSSHMTAAETVETILRSG
jgi:adenylylsulfate kinase-like enzyme